MVVKPETVFRTPWFQIATVDPGPEVSGTTEPYYCLVRPAGVIGLVLDEAGCAVMIEQHRPPIGRTTLEMPAGAIEDGETTDEAITREILEETGYICERIVRVTPLRLMLNRENVIEYFYIGLRARKAPDFRERERSTVRLLERNQLLGLVRSHQFEQSVALGAMYVADKVFGIDLLKDKIETIEARLLVGLSGT